MRQIKIIWDFRGPASLNTAKHHAIHLEEYANAEKLPFIKIGTDSLSEMFNTAYIIVLEEHMLTVRDNLKPHRAELYNPE